MLRITVHDLPGAVTLATRREHGRPVAAGAGAMRQDILARRTDKSIPLASSDGAVTSIDRQHALLQPWPTVGSDLSLHCLIRSIVDEDYAALLT